MLLVVLAYALLAPQVGNYPPIPVTHDHRPNVHIVRGGAPADHDLGGGLTTHHSADLRAGTIGRDECGGRGRIGGHARQPSIDVVDDLLQSPDLLGRVVDLVQT